MPSYSGLCPVAPELAASPPGAEMATVTHRTAKLQRFLIILKDHTPSSSEKTLNSCIPLEDLICAKTKTKQLIIPFRTPKPETPNPQTLLSCPSYKSKLQESCPPGSGSAAPADERPRPEELQSSFGMARTPFR